MAIVIKHKGYDTPKAILLKLDQPKKLPNTPLNVYSNGISTDRLHNKECSNLVARLFTVVMAWAGPYFVYPLSAYCQISLLRFTGYCDDLQFDQVPLASVLISLFQIQYYAKLSLDSFTRFSNRIMYKATLLFLQRQTISQSQLPLFLPFLANFSSSFLFLLIQSSGT